MNTEKYHLEPPTNFSDLLGNPQIISTLSSMSIYPNLLFYGPAGVGKTSCATIISKNFSSINCLKLNASDDRGIETIRTRIKMFCESSAFVNKNSNEHNRKRKLIILDEADSMTKAAQFCLRRIIEDYTHVTFILICNYSSNIIPAISSRFTNFRFNPICPDQIFLKLKANLQNKNIEFDEQSLKNIIKTTEGDFRSCLNQIEGLIKIYGRLNFDEIEKFYGKRCDEKIFKEIVEKIKEKNIKEAFEIFNKCDWESLLGNIYEKELVCQAAEYERRILEGFNLNVQMGGFFGVLVLFYSKKD